MFQIGDTVVYPMHGAGVVKSIEERQILGEFLSYYIITINHGHMEVMVPVDGCENAGLRSVSVPSDFDPVFETLSAESTVMDDNWNRRNRDNMEKMKTGQLTELASIIRNLVRIDRIKKLSTGEKKLLSNAKMILVSEMEVVLNMSEEEALAKIDNLI